MIRGGSMTQGELLHCCCIGASLMLLNVRSVDETRHRVDWRTAAVSLFRWMLVWIKLICA